MPRALIIDDNKESAQTLGWLVESFGYETELAFTGKAALEAASRASFALVLVDITLPDMNGYDLLTELKKTHNSQAVFVAQTGLDRAADMQKSVTAGFDFHLVKPVDIVTLKEIAEKVLASGPTLKKTSAG